jgi:peptidoglycan L-alanyl-D-glutamate endopeptidase CwlK
MDANSQARLELVHPKLAEAIRKMADMLSVEGIEIRVTQGYRSWTDQLNLWMKGRDVTGQVTDRSKVVTNAPPGHSYHNFGLAVDVAPFTDNTPDWNLNHPVWKRIVTVGKSLGLTAGAEWRTFPDWPHFQLTGTLPVSPDDSVRQAFHEGGTVEVWKKSGLEEQV